jgi:hypothetical protein
MHAEDPHLAGGNWRVKHARPDRAIAGAFAALVLQACLGSCSEAARPSAQTPGAEAPCEGLSIEVLGAPPLLAFRGSELEWYLVDLERLGVNIDRCQEGVPLAIDVRPFVTAHLALRPTDAGQVDCVAPVEGSPRFIGPDLPSDAIQVIAAGGRTRAWVDFGGSEGLMLQRRAECAVPNTFVARVELWVTTPKSVTWLLGQPGFEEAKRLRDAAAAASADGGSLVVELPREQAEQVLGARFDVVSESEYPIRVLRSNAVTVCIAPSGGDCSDRAQNHP